MKEGRFEDLLEICLNRLDRGENLPDILKSYPSLETRLKPMLLVAMLSRALPQPAPRHTSIRTGMNHLLVEMDKIQAAGGFRKVKPEPTRDRILERWLESIPNPFSPDRTGGLSPSYRLAIITLVLVMGGSFLTLSASASGFSGNVFNNLKRGLERVRSVFIFNQPVVGNNFENEEIPRGNPANQGQGIGLNHEEVILPAEQKTPKNEEGDPGSAFVFDLSADESIKELKKAEIEEMKVEKEAEREAKKAEKEAEKEAKKAAKDKTKKEKDLKAKKIKPDKEKPKKDK